MCENALIEVVDKILKCIRLDIVKLQRRRRGRGAGVLSLIHCIAKVDTIPLNDCYRDLGAEQCS